MIKVLFNTPNPKLSGGPPTHLPLLAKELEKSVTLINYSYGRKEEYETISTKVFGRLLDLVKVIFKILRYKPNIIHLNSAADKMTFLRDYMLIKISRLLRVPVFLKFHGSFNAEYYESLSGFYKNLRRYILVKSSAVGVLSDYEKDFYVTSFPLLEKKIIVVKNIIKEDFFGLIKYFSDKPEILFISRCIKQKGIFDLLEAIPDVLKKYPETKFIFVGGGKDATEFDDKCNSMSLNGNVIRYDNISNTETVMFYESAWALVFPTHMPEGMPMVIAESMSAGVPIITTKTRFALSYFKEPDNCLFIEIGNSNSISEKIVDLIGNIELRERMSTNNSKMAESFSKEKVCEEFISIYKNILGKSKN